LQLSDSTLVLWIRLTSFKPYRLLLLLRLMAGLSESHFEVIEADSIKCGLNSFHVMSKPNVSNGPSLHPLQTARPLGALAILLHTELHTPPHHHHHHRHHQAKPKSPADNEVPAATQIDQNWIVLVAVVEDTWRINLWGCGYEVRHSGTVGGGEGLGVKKIWKTSPGPQLPWGR
jgi:hypothetical protein